MQKIGLLRKPAVPLPAVLKWGCVIELIKVPLSCADFSAWHAVREQVAIYSAWAALVWLLHERGHMPMVSSAGSLVGILSMVTGLLVSFRASSSYER